MKKTVLFSLFLLMGLTTACNKCPEQSAKVGGRYVPERKDDFAWENEYAAFRLYGPALASENPSNGVDLWLKNTPALVVDTMYGRELKDHRPYHINYDGNLDCYKVAHTAGCGGVVILADNRLWIGGPYSRWEILEQTPDRFSFRLYYDSVLVGEQVLAQTLTITAKAGNLWNKADVVLYAPHGVETISTPLMLGGGIYLHDSIDHCFTNEQTGLVAYAEDALSDKQAARMNYEFNGSTSQGRSYIAVRTPGAKCLKEIDGTLVAVRPYQLGDTLTYYFAGGWSEYFACEDCRKKGERLFPTDEAWFEAVNKD